MTLLSQMNQGTIRSKDGSVGIPLGASIECREAHIVIVASIPIAPRTWQTHVCTYLPAGGKALAWLEVHHCISASRNSNHVVKILDGWQLPLEALNIDNGELTTKIYNGAST